MAENGEINESALKSSKFTGYHAFYQSVAGRIKESLPDADLGAMSKTASCMWSRCSSYVRKDWKKEGQRIREDIDCGIAIFKCQKCQKSFPRAKDAAYHEKHCGEGTCNTCGKTFLNQLALRRHMVIHQEKYKCETCYKSFGGQASLKRHLKIHNGTQEKHFACNICDAKNLQQNQT